MASKRFEKGSIEWNLFQDLWSLCQKVWIPEDTGEYFELFENITNEFRKKYESEPFAVEAVKALSNTIDKKDRELRKTKNDYIRRKE